MILINANKFYHQPFFKPEHETIFIEQLWKLMRIPFFSTSLHDATLLLCFPFIAEAEVLIVTIINVMLLWEETNKAKTVLALPKIDVVIIFSVIRMKKCTAAGKIPVFSHLLMKSQRVLLSGHKHSFKNAFNLVHKNNNTMFIGDEEGDEKEPIDDDYNAKSMLTD